MFLTCRCNDRNTLQRNINDMREAKINCSFELGRFIKTIFMLEL